MDFTSDISLEGIYKAIYDRVLLSMTTSSRAKAKQRYGCYDFPCLDKKWEGYHLLDFVNHIRPPTVWGSRKETPFDRSLKDEGIRGGLAEVQKLPTGKSAFTEEKSAAIFRALARFQDIPHPICFLEFLKFCESPVSGSHNEPLPLHVFEEQGMTPLNEFISELESNIDRQRRLLLSAGIPERERRFIAQLIQREDTIVLGDAIGIETDIDKIGDLRILAKLSCRYAEDIDEFEGVFSPSKNRKTWNHWIRDYGLDDSSLSGDALIQFIENNIQAQSCVGVREAAKVGFVAYNHNETELENQMSIVIRPVNHLMVTAFNRKLAAARLSDDDKSPAHELWNNCMSKAHRPQEAVIMPCPSQLFLEMVLITADNKIPITFKKDKTSVYAQRNGERKLKTCGLERGPNWRDVVKSTDDPNLVELDFLPGILKGLEKEFRMDEMPDWDQKKGLIKVTMAAFVQQALHLNTALLGYCKVPYKSDDLLKLLKGTGAGGLDHSELEFNHIDACDKVVKEHDLTTEWHGTAVMRLQIVYNRRKEIQEDEFS